MDTACTNNVPALPVRDGAGLWGPGLRTPRPVLILRGLSAAAGAPEDAGGQGEASCGEVGGRSGKEGKGPGCPGRLCQWLRDGENQSESPSAFCGKDAAGGGGCCGPQGRGVVDRSCPPSMPAFLEQGAWELSSFQPCARGR